MGAGICKRLSRKPALRFFILIWMTAVRCSLSTKKRRKAKGSLSERPASSAIVPGQTHRTL